MNTNLKERIAKLETELDELKAELNKNEYCLNVYTEMPKKDGEYYFVGAKGNIIFNNNVNEDIGNSHFENTILFKDQKSAETYKELRQDMKRLSKEFVYNDDNCCFVYDRATKKIDIACLYSYNFACHYFTEENAQYILDKYGRNVLKNYILYCK